MSSSQIFYEVMYSTPEFEMEPMGYMYGDRAEAEEELRQMKPRYPTAFLARVVFTRIEESKVSRSLRAV